MVPNQRNVVWRGEGVCQVLGVALAQRHYVSQTKLALGCAGTQQPSSHLKQVMYPERAEAEQTAVSNATNGEADKDI